MNVLISNAIEIANCITTSPPLKMLFLLTGPCIDLNKCTGLNDER